MESLALHFCGPLTFAAGENCLFDSSLRDETCVYLWTIRSDRDGKYYIHYVGEAMSFAARQREHLIHILGLDYGVFDVAKAKQGERALRWKGLWRDGRRRRRNEEGSKAFYGSATEAIERYAKHAGEVVDYVNAIAVFVAKVELDDTRLAALRRTPGWDLPDARLQQELRRHLEGKIGWNLRNNHSDAGVLYPPDQHIGTSVNAMSMRLELSSDEDIAGLDPAIDV